MHYVTWLLTAFSILPLWAETAPQRQPNVVFILADDLGWMDAGVQGSRYYKTPNIDALATRSMRFTQAFTANPLCSPTRASILTGLYPGRLHLTMPECHEPVEHLTPVPLTKDEPWCPTISAGRVNRLLTTHRTFATSFKEAGYRTGHFGKWHLGREPYDPLHHGYDIDLPHWWAGWPGDKGAGYIAPWKYPDSLHFTGKPGEHIEDRMASEAVRFITDNKDRPFLLSYWAFSVHSPFNGKPEYIERYKSTIDPKNPQRCPAYAAMVNSLDDAVGTLVDTLHRLQLTDNTIIIFTSDNGGDMYDRVDGIPPTSNAPLRNGKASIYDGGTRVPCLVSWPEHIKPGSISDQLISSIDWAPTLHELSGVKTAPNQTFDGVSIVPALNGGTLSRDTLFCYFPHNIAVTGNYAATWVRQGDWKLIRFFNAGPNGAHRYELYNIAKDIGETTNLADKESQRVTTLDALIDKHLADIGAPTPVVNPAYNSKLKPKMKK